MSSKSRNNKPNTKKEKLTKLINNSDAENGETERELSFYINDRVKLMKEVLKIIKPRKIRSMAPNCIKNLDNDEINSMLLEELLGISNKRLKYIFNGQNLEEDSSTDPEEEQNPVDIISLDDISDDEFVIDLDSDNENKRKRCKKHRKIKVEPKKIKKEKHKDSKNESTKGTTEGNEASEENLMSVLELLELQARARAIRSQLALENKKKAEESQKVQAMENIDSDDNDDAVIITSPKNEEIVITSSDSENESSQVSTVNENTYDSNKEADKSVEDNSNPALENDSNAAVEDSSNPAEKHNSNPAEEQNSSPAEDKNSKDHDGKTNPRTEVKNQEIDILDKADQENSRKSSNNIIIHQNDIVQQPNKESQVTEIQLSEPPSEENDKRKRHKKCRHKNRERSALNVSDQIDEKRLKVKTDTSGKMEELSNQEKTNQDYGDGLILNVEQSEIDCINLD